MDNLEDYKKAVDMLKKRQEYNKQYYAKKKKETDPTQIKKCGRKAIEEITPERAAEALQKYKLKCQKQSKQLNTAEEIKQEINRLITKLKKMMPDK
jgi:hypothetical protein